MKEHKKYMDIVRLGHKTTQGVLKKGDYITITEKIDGANAHFILDEDSPIRITCGSRNLKLSESNALNGFYFYVAERINPDLLTENYRYYGEWLTSHKVQYKPEAYKQFYLFSIYDESIGRYLSDEIVKSEAVKLGLATPEYFYEGEYISFEHLLSFVGKSNLSLTPNSGEGVVVKNVNYTDNYGNQCFVKLVSEAFAEIQKQKLPKDPSQLDVVMSLVQSVLTKPRVEKILLKKVDEGELNSEFGIEDMGKILKLITSEIFNDCIKEESEVFENKDMDSIRKAFGKYTPVVVKEVLKDRELK